MRKSILFVDDDPTEIARFKEAMGARYIVEGGVSLEDALKELHENTRIGKPDLVLLDLYYGPTTSLEQRIEIKEFDLKLSAMETEFGDVLRRAGQSPNGGFDLAQEAHDLMPTSARAFFSRKAFLKDALRAHENGLPVVEKPDPNADDEAARDPYRAAMHRHADDLSRKLNRIISQNTFWAKHREAISGVWIGFLVSFGWDVLKGSFLKNWLATAAFLAGAIALTLAVWVAKRL
jgi:hypothetical protein